MRLLLSTIVLTVAGLVIAQLMHLSEIDQSSGYVLIVTILLGVGLYSTVFAIEPDDLRANIRVVLAAITVGVLVKIAVIGGIAYLVSGDPLFLLLGVIVAQMDPLSVSAVMSRPRLSQRSKAILASWSSFDDPVTVIASWYVAYVVADEVGVGRTQSAINVFTGVNFDVLANIAFAGAIFLLYRILRRHETASSVLLVVGFVVSLRFFLMLGIATTAIFLGPKLGRYLAGLARPALYASAFLLGLILVDGVQLMSGIILGASAVVGQMVVAGLITIRLPTVDRVHLALSQQNGVTAIILALLFESEFEGVVAIVAPRILVINSLHVTLNWLLDRYGGRVLGNTDRAAAMTD